MISSTFACKEQKRQFGGIFAFLNSLVIIGIGLKD